MHRKPLLSLSLRLLVALTFATLPVSTLQADDSNRPNILFIAVDDLRPELGCYGSEIAITPNIDKLAQNGVLFERAYCQQPICAPSRASLMCGARTDTLKLAKNADYFRDLNPEVVTLSQHLIANGYDAVQVGKIYHNDAHSDNEKSWNRQPAKITLPKAVTYALPENRAIQAKNKEILEAKYGVGIGRTGLVQGPAYEMADVPDTTYRDGRNAQVAIETLKELKEDGKPFFLGMGFYKPHLDFIAPKKYWDLYDPAKIPAAPNPVPPEGSAAMGLHASFELRVRDGIPKKGNIGPELATTLKHAYLACASYIDAQIGMVMNALDESGLRDNTIVVFWGDHGWHLGEMGIWGKATNYEISARVPLIISLPDKFKGAKGKNTDALTELVDLYPTLCDFAEIETPAHVEGTSLKPVLLDPTHPWKKAAFTQFPNPALREWAAAPLSPGMRETFFGPLIEEVEAKITAQQGENWDRELYENHLMGYSMRTDQHRLVLWQDMRKPESDPVFVELYHYADSTHETKNIADENPELVAKLLKQFRSGWKGSLPSKK
ncbi:MAG: sulfatase [Roseibacillus sp.]